MIMTTTNHQPVLFEQQTKTESTSACRITGHNSLIGSIGETYFDLWCLGKGISVYAPVAQNARVDRIIETESEFFRIHIKTATLTQSGHVFTLWTTNNWRVREGLEDCKAQAAPADFFACVGIYQNKAPEKIWWLPYGVYKNQRSIKLDSSMTELLAVPNFN